MAAAEPDIFHHVRDSSYFHLPGNTHLELPPVFGLQLTKFMVLQLVAGVFLFFVFRGLARRINSGLPVRGAWWNFWEAIALYIRDNVVRPTIGYGHHGDHEEGHEEFHARLEGHGEHPEPLVDIIGHPADRYLPFVWTCFFYVLICNLLGAFPWLG